MPGAEDATLETTWADLDVDSLDLVELVKALEDRYEHPDRRRRAEADRASATPSALVQELARREAAATRVMAADVVVTGRGVVTSLGEGADAFFDALLAALGRSPTASAPAPTSIPSRR